jgi:hypothetical protein
METTNYLERVKSFPARHARGLVLRVALTALFAVALAHAAPSFNAPNYTNVDYDDDNCNTSPGTLSGAVTNGGLGVSLYGSGSMSANWTYNCEMTLIWQGTGSGAFYGTTATVSSNFTMTVPSDVTVSSCTLTVYVNATQEGQFSCGTGNGNQVLSAQTFTVPASLSTYEVKLDIIAYWTDAAGSTLTVSVSPATSIDLLALAAPATPTVPTLSTAALGALGLLLAGAGALLARARRTARA